MKQAKQIDDLYGMVHRQDLNKIPDSAAVFLKNVTLTRTGNWNKRKGTDLKGATQTGVGVFGLISYNPTGGTYTLHSIRDQDADTYSSTTDVWTEIDANQFTASTRVESTNFLDRIYSITTADFLCYESGSTYTDVGAANDRLKGTDIDIAQQTLFVGGITYGNGSVQSWQNRVYYSLFNAGSDILPSHQLWENSEGSLTASTRFFTVKGPIMGLYSYNDLIHVFTNKDCTTFDMRYEQQGVGPQIVFSQGLANTRSICTCNGYMIFMSPDKRLWAWGGSAPLMELSWDIEDDEQGRALINAISEAEVSNIALGSLGNQFFVSVGNITFLGETINNAVIRGLVTQNLNSVMWSVDSYPVRPVIFANTRINNKEVLCFGTSAADLVEDIYQMEIGVNDGVTGTVAVDSYGRTKFLDFGMPIKSKTGDSIYIEYAPQSTQDTYLEVKYAIDGKYSYLPITDPDATTPVTNHSDIDMYSSDSATKTDAMQLVKFPAGVSFRTLSIETGNGQLNESYEVKSIAFFFEDMDLNIKPRLVA